MLVFDAEKHIYRNPYTDQEYTSVTTLLNKFKKPFDVQAASERVAKREGKTAEEVQTQWKQMNSESKKYGTKIHNVIETYHKTKEVPLEYASLIESYVSLNVLSDKDELLVEQQLYLHTNKIAGTADIIRLNIKGGFDVFDIKTNKKFNFYSQYNEKLLPPISHLDACEYTTYGLQLSLYAYMYHAMTGRRLQRMGIFYYNREDNKFIFYPVPYMESDIIKILQTYAQS